MFVLFLYRYFIISTMKKKLKFQGYVLSPDVSSVYANYVHQTKTTLCLKQIEDKWSYIGVVLVVLAAEGNQVVQGHNVFHVVYSCQVRVFFSAVRLSICPGFMVKN